MREKLILTKHSASTWIWRYCRLFAVLLSRAPHILAWRTSAPRVCKCLGAPYLFQKLQMEWLVSTFHTSVGQLSAPQTILQSQRSSTLYMSLKCPRYRIAADTRSLPVSTYSLDRSMFHFFLALLVGIFASVRFFNTLRLFFDLLQSWCLFMYTQMTMATRNEARRFISLVDALYECKTKLFASFAIDLDMLFTDVREHCSAYWFTLCVMTSCRYSFVAVFTSPCRSLCLNLSTKLSIFPSSCSTVKPLMLTPGCAYCFLTAPMSAGVWPWCNTLWADAWRDDGRALLWRQMLFLWLPQNESYIKAQMGMDGTKDVYKNMLFTGTEEKFASHRLVVYYCAVTDVRFSTNLDVFPDCTKCGVRPIWRLIMRSCHSCFHSSFPLTSSLAGYGSCWPGPCSPGSWSNWGSGGSWCYKHLQRHAQQACVWRETLLGCRMVMRAACIDLTFPDPFCCRWEAIVKKKNKKKSKTQPSSYSMFEWCLKLTKNQSSLVPNGPYDISQLGPGMFDAQS